MKIEEKYKLEKYIKEDGSEVNVYFDIDKQTIWLTQKELCLLFNKSKSTISEHIKYLFSNKLINPNNVMEFGNTEQGCSIIYYNYEVVFLLIGRIRNANISKFKDWVNDNLIKVKENNSIDIKKYEIVEFNDENISLDVNVDYEHDTVCLNRRQIALLFNVLLIMLVFT